MKCFSLLPLLMTVLSLDKGNAFRDSFEFEFGLERKIVIFGVVIELSVTRTKRR